MLLGQACKDDDERAVDRGKPTDREPADGEPADGEPTDGESLDGNADQDGATVSDAPDAGGTELDDDAAVDSWPMLEIGEGCHCASDEVCGPDQTCAPACSERGDCALWIAERGIVSLYAQDDSVYWVTEAGVDDLGNPLGGRALWTATYPNETATQLALGNFYQILGVQEGYLLFRTAAGVPTRLRLDAPEEVEPLWPSFTPAEKNGESIGLGQPALMNGNLYAAGSVDGRLAIWKLPANGEGAPVEIAPLCSQCQQLVVGGGVLLVSTRPSTGWATLYAYDAESGQLLLEVMTSPENKFVGVDEERWVAADPYSVTSGELAVSDSFLLNFAPDASGIFGSLLRHGWVYNFERIQNFEAGTWKFRITRAPTRIGRQVDVVVPVTPSYEATDMVYAASDAGLFWTLNRWNEPSRIFYSPITPPPCKAEIDCGGTGLHCTQGLCQTP